MRQTFGIALALVLALPSLGMAQTTVPLDRFNVNLFSPAIGPNNYLEVDGARIDSHLTPAAGLFIDYAHEPFVLFDASCTDDSMTNCDVDDVNTELVSWLLTGNIWGSLTLFNRVQVGLVVPVSFGSGEDFETIVGGDTPIRIPGGSTAGLGDVRINAKVRITGEGDGLYFGANVFATLPTAQLIDDESFGGDDSLTVGAEFIGQFVQNGIHVAGNVGGFYRGEQTFLSSAQGSQLTYSLAVGYEITPLIMVFAELDGASSFSSEVDENPLEAAIAGRMRQGDFEFTLAAGAGLVSGAGIPVVRVIGGFAWAPSRGDRDGDGVLDTDDACPGDPEDRDDWEDEDGCPEADNDGDGMLDGDDPCPNEAEDIDEFQDEDGCPDRDNDEDGISDGFDSCPNDAEDMDGDRDEDGCPDQDTDRDGIPDATDQCPDEPEDTDGFGDEDGCPEVDFDGDGLPDDADDCPDEPEIMNGVEDEDGCPEDDQDGDRIVDTIDNCPAEAETLNGVRDDDGCADGEASVAVEGNRINLLVDVEFRGNGSPRRPALRVLNAVATLLSRHPEYRQVEVQVGGSNGEARVAAVIAHLTNRGVPADRLIASAQAEGDGTLRLSIRGAIAGQEAAAAAAAPAPAAPAE